MIPLMEVKYAKVPNAMSNQNYKNFDNNEDGSSSDMQFDSTPSVSFKYVAGSAIGGASTFWKRRSVLERALLVIVVLCAIIIIVLSALVGQKHHQVNTMKQKERCTTPACVTLASSMINAMDQNVDPCEDFFEYACGGWRKANLIPPGNSRWGTFNELAEANNRVIKAILENTSDVSASEAVQKARRYYTSCMDPNSTRQDLGATPLYRLMKQVGGWSISKVEGVDWQVEDFDLQKTLRVVQSYGISPFFSIYVGEDEKNVSNNIIQIDQGGISLARDEYINKTVEDKVYGAYVKYMNDIGTLLGGEKNHTYEAMMAVIEFETTLADFTTPSDQRRDAEKMYHKVTLGDIQRLAPFIDWVGTLQSALDLAEYTVDETEPVLMYAPQFLSNLSSLVTNMTQTDQGKTTLHNYMVWNLVKTFASALSSDFTDAAKQFTKTVNGIEGDVEHWKQCVDDTVDTLGFAVGSQYVQKVFHGDSKITAEKMVQDIKKAFKANLPNLKWMDGETRKLAIEKVDAVVDMIGYPSFITNATALNAKYEELVINENEYFENNVRDLRFSLKKELLKLRKPPDKTSWAMTPQEVNAYYSATSNEIVFPAGILQPPFFDQHFPLSVNYGGMGVVMGHELTHGFDDEGREFDKNGMLHMWWPNDTISKFNDVKQCFVNQYSNYSIKGVNGDEYINGVLTQGENIADNGGLTAAYHAYRAVMAGEEEPLMLPGLDLTHDQLFFLAFSQVWCSNEKPESLHNLVLSNPHSPGRFRVIGTLSNSKDFAKHYKCSETSRMNPQNKCVIW